MADNLPDIIDSLSERCESNELTFSNAEMSIALTYAMFLYRRLTAMAVHYQRLADSKQEDHEPVEVLFRQTMQRAADDMRHILTNTKADCS